MTICLVMAVIFFFSPFTCILQVNLVQFFLPLDFCFFFHPPQADSQHQVAKCNYFGPNEIRSPLMSTVRAARFNKKQFTRLTNLQLYKVESRE